MNLENPDERERLKRFSYRLWSCQDVVDTCLHWQKSIELDTSFLFWAAWIGAEWKCELGRTELVAAEAHVEAWQKVAIQAARALRTYTTGLDRQHYPVPKRLTERILAIEIELEFLEQAFLLKWSRNHLHSSDGCSSKLRANVFNYLALKSADGLASEDERRLASLTGIMEHYHTAGER